MVTRYKSLQWQRPVRTEEWALEAVGAKSLQTQFFDYIGFPWATLIDLKRRNRVERADELERILVDFGPKTTLVRATVCQHIWATDMLEQFKALKITDLFWSHATISQQELGGIRIHPFPLYPVAFEDRMGAVLPSAVLQRPRSLLYNFVGAFDARLYLSEVRRWIFELPQRSDACVSQTDSWYFEKAVYKDQIENGSSARTPDFSARQDQQGYRKLLEQSHFTLCPSGAGPNTIRFWEALGAGSVPVLISDNLRLPGSGEEWTAGMIRIPEKEEAIRNLPRYLEELVLDAEAMRAYRLAGAALWERFILEGPRKLISRLSSLTELEQLTRLPPNG